MYGPLWVFLNRGFDVLQDHIAPRQIFSFDYRTNTGNVLRNVVHPFPAISARRVGDVPEGGDLPAQLHAGDGALDAQLQPALDRRRHDLPRAARVVRGPPHARSARLGGRDGDASALVNESLENHGVVGFNTDCLADLYVFDIGGIILFSFDAPSRFFSHQVGHRRLVLAAVVHGAEGQLHNVGNYFAAKWALPFYRRLSLFSWFGEATTGGLSFKLNDEYARVGGGGRRRGSPQQRVDQHGRQHRHVRADGRRLSRQEQLAAGVTAGDRHGRLLHSPERLPARVHVARPGHRGLGGRRSGTPGWRWASPSAGPSAWAPGGAASDYRRRQRRRFSAVQSIAQTPPRFTQRRGRRAPGGVASAW